MAFSVRRRLYHEWQNARPHFGGKIAAWIIGSIGWVTVATIPMVYESRSLLTSVYLLTIIGVLVGPKLIEWIWPFLSAVRVLRQIRFNSVLGPPEWEMVAPLGTEPIQDLADLDGESAVRITPRGNYAMTNSFEYVYRTATQVEFVGQFDHDCVPYVRLSGTTPDGKTCPMWFAIRFGNSHPEKTEFVNEWNIFVSPINEGSAVRLRIKLAETFLSSFGKSGCELHGVSGVRLRGRMTIAGIDVIGH